MTKADQMIKDKLAEAEKEDEAACAEGVRAEMAKLKVTIEVGDDEPSGEYVCPDCGKAAVKK